MTRAAVDELLDRFGTAETVGEAEDALVALAALDSRELGAAAEHEPIGDLYAELALGLFDENVFDEAVRLQELALDEPCTNRWRELGTLLGYRFVGGEDEEAISALVTTKTGRPTDAYLVGAFAEIVEHDAPELALDRFDEALAAARSGDDGPALLDSVRVPRALARESAGHAPDADDEAGFAALAAMEAEMRSEEADEAHQLFVSREDLEAVRARWPDASAGLDLADEAVYYADLEQLWRLMPATGNMLHLHPIVFEQFDRFQARAGRIVAELPEGLATELMEGDAARTWPPGRNDACWCGSGRKYKRCCGAA